MSDAVIGAAAASDHPVLVVIDGRSGAGKSSLAEMLVAQWPLPGPAQLVALDALYPGWDGMDAGVELARRDIAEPFARGEDGRYRRWDWAASRYAEEHVVASDRALILEGCGALTPAIAGLAQVRVWVQSPDAARKARALERDGDTFAPHWDRWAAHEERHIARDDPRGLADLVVTVP